MKNSNQFKNPFLILPILLVGAVIISLLVLPKLKKPTTTSAVDQEKARQILESNDLRSFTDITRQIGAQKAYQLVKIQFPDNNTSAHDFAHIIGIVAHEKDSIAGLKLCDTAYNYGCYHGFIESFIAQNTVSEVAQIEDGCMALGPVHAPSCLHGIGHGVMVDASYKLDLALENCSSNLKETSQIYCWDGVFMERIVGSMQTQEDKPKMTDATLQEPCDSVKTIYKDQCWRNQVSAWLPFFSSNTKKVGDQCSLLEQVFQKTCFESLGLLVTITTGENADQIVNNCTTSQNPPAGGRISDDCLVGALKELLFEGKNPAIAQSLCSSVSSTNQFYCQQTYNDHLAQSRARFGR